MKKSLLESLTELQRNDFIGGGSSNDLCLSKRFKHKKGIAISKITTELMSIEQCDSGIFRKLERHDFDQERFEPMNYTLTNLTITKVSPYQNHN